jgi:hypothetical protein
MGEVKRDDVRRACEAVGWEWSHGDSAFLDASMTLRFPAPYEGQEADRDRDNLDAFALLEAFRLQDPMFRDWSLESPVDYDKEDGGFRACVTDRLGDGKTSWYYDHPDAPDAAVGAVLAWKGDREGGRHG